MSVQTVTDTSSERRLMRDAFNAIRRQLGAGGAIHLDASEVQPVLGAAVDLASDIALVNHLKRIFSGGNYAGWRWSGHVADDLLHLGAAPILTPDAGVIASPDATDQASADTLATELKAKFNGHLTNPGVHFTDDVINAVVALDGNGTEARLRTLVNAIRTAMLAHLGDASAPAGCAPMIRLVAP